MRKKIVIKKDLEEIKAKMMAQERKIKLAKEALLLITILGMAMSGLVAINFAAALSQPNNIWARLVGLISFICCVAGDIYILFLMGSCYGDYQNAKKEMRMLEYKKWDCMNELNTHAIKEVRSKFTKANNKAYGKKKEDKDVCAK